MKAFVLAWLLSGAIGFAIDIVLYWRGFLQVFLKVYRGDSLAVRIVCAALTIAIGILMGPVYCVLLIHPPGRKGDPR